MVAYIDAIAIDTKFRTRRGIVQIVFPLMLQHARPFVPSVFIGVVVVARYFPAVLIYVVLYQHDGFSLGTETILRVHLHAHYRVGIGTPPVEIYLAVIILEEAQGQ